MALAACTDDGTTPVDEVPLNTAPADGTTVGPGTADEASPSAPQDGPATTPDGTTEPDGSTTAPVELTPTNDGGGVGANGRALLRGDRARIVVEVDVQEGASVDQAALDHLVDELSRHVDKAGGITFAGGNTFASDDEEWTTDDLRAAASSNRSTATDGQQVSIHVLYVRGSHHQDGQETAAIGLAYSASTIAMWPERWSGMGGLLGSDRAIERAVLVHELGHLLGLVNLTYQSDIAHEDAAHPGHSNNQDSVMFHAIESTLIGQLFSGPPPDRFDEADASDLAGLREGRL
jgi:hypothetical protein